MLFQSFSKLIIAFPSHCITKLFVSSQFQFGAGQFHAIPIPFKSKPFFTIPFLFGTKPIRSIPRHSNSLHILTFPLLCLGSQLSHHSFDTSKSLSLLISNINCCSNSGILSESRLSASSIKIGSLTSFIFWNPLTISASHRILSP